MTFSEPSKECEKEAPFAVLDRLYYGMNTGCDCRGIFSSRRRRIENENSYVDEIMCSYNQTIAGCEQV